MDEAWAKIKVNRMVLTMNIIICCALTAGYIMDFAKGRKTAIFVAIFIVIMAVQLVACIAVYRKSRTSESFKYFSVIGYLVIYCFAMFSSDTYFTFVYVFPMALLFILYYDVGFIKKIVIAIAILNVAKIVFQVYNKNTSDTDITSYTVQIASVVIFCIGVYFLTNLTMRINNERIEKLLETNKSITDLAKKAEESSQAEAALIRDVEEISYAFISESKQIADGSQMLAQGASEQAASVERLSGSVSEIANKTKENATIADEAAKLADTIKDKAGKGSLQMNDMMAAVNEINEASSSIRKVIKVIDDIAFQTNILALNAAVEAARAGQHGKGFAVVAEEVRNLAAKSAEAAKDTNSLIESSIEKARLGVRIAGDTADSLNEIVTGINESNRLMGEIAKLSIEQSSGIEQVNIGIDRVAQIVRQNSMTAEESAAASGKMSGQADMLQELMSRFERKDRGLPEH